MLSRQKPPFLEYPEILLTPMSFAACGLGHLALAPEGSQFVQSGAANIRELEKQTEHLRHALEGETKGTRCSDAVLSLSDSVQE
jgi:hypothetical protein